MQPRQRVHELKVLQPCHVPWDEMQGDDRSRFCKICEKQVYNFSQMHESEIIDCLRDRSESVCAQIRRSDDGRIVTKQCKPSRRWFQFSLFSLLALMTTVATLLGFSSHVQFPEQVEPDDWVAYECGGVVEIPDDFFADDTSGNDSSTEGQP